MKVDERDVFGRVPIIESSLLSIHFGVLVAEFV
jgi:hypothetical protein